MKKEKYIVRQKRKSCIQYIVKFKYKVNNEIKQYSKAFNVSDYTSERECLNAACDHRDIKRSELLQSGLPSGNKRTIDKVLEDYIRISHQTVGNATNIRSFYHKWIEAGYGSKYINDIKPIDIQMSLNAMIYEASQNTIGRVFCVWKKICHTAIMLDLITINPCDRVEIPKSQMYIESRQQTCSDEDIKRLIDYFLNTGRNEEDSYNNKLIAYTMVVMSETGMRPAEVYALTRNDLDFDGKTIRINKSIRSDENMKRTVGNTKTATSRRIIPMTLQCEIALKTVCSMSDNTLIFSQYDGSIPDSVKISQHINTIARRQGIEFHLYMLRHRFSTELVTNNVDVRTVMELMGHKNPNMTVSYARSDDEKKRNAISELVTLSNTNSEKLLS